MICAVLCSPIIMLGVFQFIMAFGGLFCGFTCLVRLHLNRMQRVVPQILGKKV